MLRIHDCYYTSERVVKQCLQLLDKVLVENRIAKSNFDLWLEPSAGEGAFFDLLPPNRLGFDILKSKNPMIEEKDFLSIPIEYFTSQFKCIITVGNPPFGKNSKLAVKFFNRCAQFSDCIAMVFPKTFLKSSVQNRLNLYFRCVKSFELSEDSFIFDGSAYDVPSVFQVWLKEQTERKKQPNPLTHEDFEFTTREHADFAVQRVGVAAGKIKEEFENYADASHYFIRSVSPDVDVKKLFLRINWESVKHNTAGNPSISRPELVNLYALEKDKL